MRNTRSLDNAIWQLVLLQKCFIASIQVFGEHVQLIKNYVLVYENKKLHLRCWPLSNRSKDTVSFSFILLVAFNLVYILNC